MINTREHEIREEAVALTIAAYELVSDLPSTLNHELKAKFLDDGFLVSSMIAEAFRHSHVDYSEQDIKIGLGKLLELKEIANGLETQFAKRRTSLDRFVHLAEELQVELTELLAAIKQLKEEPYSLKLELACI